MGGVEELGIRVLAGNRIHLRWFTCGDCNGSVTYKAWVEFGEQPERLPGSSWKPLPPSRAAGQGAERVLLQHSEGWCWGGLGMPVHDESWRNTAAARNVAQERRSGEGIPGPPPLPSCSLSPSACGQLNPTPHAGPVVLWGQPPRAQSRAEMGRDGIWGKGSSGA